MSKRILFMNTGTGWGGVEKWHYDTALALQKRGYKIFVLGIKDEMFYNKCKEAGLTVANIEHIGDVTFINPFRLYWLVKYLKKNSIDAIFFCQSSHFKYGSLAAKLAGVESIIYRRALAKPIKNKFYNRWLLKYCVTDFMSISEVTRDENLKKIPNDYLAQEKIKLIYKGVKKDKFINPKIISNLREEFGIEDDELIIGNVGRLCRQKAQQYLIEALPIVLKEIDRIRVLLVGGSNDREKLYRKKVKELGLEDKVIFTGFREDIPSILKQLDFMVHTAIYEGGAPWVILEAMMAGVPIVTTDATTIPEFVTDGVNGYLAKNKDPDDIAKNILKMINNSERDKLGQKSAEIAREKFSFEKMVDEIEEKILNK
ncbi:glycosyltransferase [Sporohalobacter salinus]|uniref:glycosyltransferase n=1 Tax=Sporohalobacter salinus TaxID=1494606 RepID=UPI001961497C|nr:glycosyltransferase [Sporohalobacter salinus]MBM7622958.1 glycosyltransferase involved in cell wall biosynthesis [Sporohalobacter salinus]